MTGKRTSARSLRKNSHAGSNGCETQTTIAQSDWRNFVTQRKSLAILVGGGPAPGINSVISAATIRGRLEGVEVVGIRDGFEWIMNGSIERSVPLESDQVSRIPFRGGSYIGIARANPTQDPKLLEAAVISLLRANVSMLITIGGDDTPFSAMKLEHHDG